MNIFRTQEHVPDVYPRKSRDFQLLCNVYDCANSAVKFDIDGIQDLKDTDLCNERVLNQLQTKLGFFTNKYIDTNSQRIILKGFPHIIRNKGSSKGIIQTIELFLKTKNIDGRVEIQTANKENVLTTITSNNPVQLIYNTYVVHMHIPERIDDTTILDELLKYIIPAGYVISYEYYDNFGVDNDIINTSDTIRIVFVNNEANSAIRHTATEGGYEKDENMWLNRVSQTPILRDEQEIITKDNPPELEKVEDYKNVTRGKWSKIDLWGIRDE